jgi:hypothetical protein
MTEPRLLPPDHPQAPKYWMHETGGKLVAAVHRYLQDQPAHPDDMSLLRAYLRQWIDSPAWDGANDQTDLANLRRDVRELRSRGDIARWLEQAFDLGIDPL